MSRTRARGYSGQVTYRKAGRGGAIGAAEAKYVDGHRALTTIADVSAHDATWAGTELNAQYGGANSAYGCMPVPGMGDNYSSRDGRKIYVSKTVIRGHITWNGITAMTQAGTVGPVRLIAIKDKRVSGTELSGENVISPGASSNANPEVSSESALMLFTNPDGWGRYQILKDRLFYPPTPSNWFDGTDGNQEAVSIPFKMTLPCNEYMQFKDSSQTIASLANISLNLIGARSGATPVSIDYVARTYFKG